MILPRNNRVMREFILNDDIDNNRRPDRARWLTTTPAKHVGQRVQPFELAPKLFEVCGREA